MEAARTNSEWIARTRSTRRPPLPEEQEVAAQAGAFAIDALESAVLLDENVLPAYLGLAHTFGNVGDLQPALSYARKGLSAAERARQIPFHLSNIASVRNTDGILQMEQALKEIVLAYETRLSAR